MVNLADPVAVGHSVEGRALSACHFGAAAPTVLFLGGVHGDEPEGIRFAEALIAQWRTHGVPSGVRVCGLPVVNPDGAHASQRVNAHGVDLNRNMPTKDWSPVAASVRYHPGPAPASEPETRALMACVEQLQPILIVSLHSWDPMINVNGPCGEVARVLAKTSGYRIADDIGYPTPGSLGTWAGAERQIPTITMELERGAAHEQLWSLHAQGFCDLLEHVAAGKSLG